MYLDLRFRSFAYFYHVRLPFLSKRDNRRRNESLTRILCGKSALDRCPRTGRSGNLQHRKGAPYSDGTNPREYKHASHGPPTPHLLPPRRSKHARNRIPPRERFFCRHQRRWRHRCVGREDRSRYAEILAETITVCDHNRTEPTQSSASKIDLSDSVLSPKIVSSISWLLSSDSFSSAGAILFVLGGRNCKRSRIQRRLALTLA